MIDHKEDITSNRERTIIVIEAVRDFIDKYPDSDST
jgi:hypothetical protein